MPIDFARRHGYLDERGGVFYVRPFLSCRSSEGIVRPTEPQSSERPAYETPTSPDPRVGARIARARREAELTQRVLADRLGVRLWMVDQWETGARAAPPAQLEQMAKVTKRSAQWFLTGTENRLTEQRADAPAAETQIAGLEAANLERLALEVADRERALAERDAELQALGRRLEETRGQADKRLAEAERQLLELERRRQELEERERLLEEATRERLQTDEAAVIGEALISAQRTANLLQAEAVQEAETTVAAARIEAKAIVTTAEHTRDLADRDRAEADELLTQLRAALEETVARWNSLAPYASDVSRQERGQDQGAASVTGQTDEPADGLEADLERDLQSRADVGQTGGQEVIASDA